MPVLNVRNIEYSFGEIPILDAINFTVKKGETLGVLGANGSGKTTLLQLCAGLLKPQKGDITLYKKNLNSYKKRERARHIAFIEQSQKIENLLTVQEIVEIGRLPYRNFFSLWNSADDKIVSNALKRVHMTKYAQEKFIHLSGGEQQRVLIARALAQESKILILDEPTNHLDLYHQLVLLSLLKNLPLTLIMSLHDLNMAARYCDKILLLKKNHIGAFGKPKDVLTEKNIREIFHLECKIVHKQTKNKANIAIEVLGLLERE